MEKDKFAIVEVLTLVFSLFDCQSLMFLIQKKILSIVYTLCECSWAICYEALHM